MSFHVAGDGWGDGGQWHGGWHDDGQWRDNGRTYDGGWDEWNGYREGRDPRWDHDRRTILHDSFRMKDCSDRYSYGFDLGPTDAVIEINCIESSRNDPTEIVGRLSMKDDRGDDVLFRIDVEGDHGEVPSRGRVFVRRWGSYRVEVEIVDYSMARTKHRETSRIKWIEFDVRVLGA